MNVVAFSYDNIYIVSYSKDNMEEGRLIRLGLNINEAKVYVALLKKGTASAGELIKVTEFHRSIVYDNLEKLIDKGLVSYVLEGKKKLFRANPAQMISEMLEKEQEKLEEKKKVAELVRKDIAKLIKVQDPNQEATIFRGVKGMKSLLQNTLDEGKDYYVFGAPKASLEIMGSQYWEIYNKKREMKKILIKMIFNEELKEWSKKIKSPLTQIKFLPKKFDSLTETMIYGDKVIIIVWSEKPIATLITDKNIANAYKSYFNLLWNSAKN